MFRAKKLQNSSDSGAASCIAAPSSTMTVATTPFISAAPMGISFRAQRLVKTRGISPLSAA